VKLILIEGIPGSGKSTLAKYLCDFLCDTGLQSHWYLEEAGDHPVHPAALKTTRKHPKFDENCLHSWSRFVDRIGRTNSWHILEGSAFQSTVRFMLEQGQDDLDGYFQRFTDVVRAVSTCLIYLRPVDAKEHSHRVALHRGPGWSGKVASYLEGTPRSQARQWEGEHGMHEFWSDYAHRCDELIESARVPTLAISTELDRQHSHLPASIAFLREIGWLPIGPDRIF
jgi:hypothetical protein